MSQWYILDLEGELWPLDEYDFKEQDKLKLFSGYEYQKDRTVDRTPPHVDLMRSLELVDYEPASDPGNFRYYPKGRMVKGLLEEYVTSMVHEYGGMEVETPPLMYSMEHPTLKSYRNRFPVRVRGQAKPSEMTVAEVKGKILLETEGKPYRPLPVPVCLQDRPKFVG